MENTASGNVWNLTEMFAPTLSNIGDIKYENCDKEMYHSRKLVLHAIVTLHQVNVGWFVLMPLIMLHAHIKNCGYMKPCLARDCCMLNSWMCELHGANYNMILTDTYIHHHHHPYLLRTSSFFHKVVGWGNWFPSCKLIKETTCFWSVVVLNDWDDRWCPKYQVQWFYALSSIICTLSL